MTVLPSILGERVEPDATLTAELLAYEAAYADKPDNFELITQVIDFLDRRQRIDLTRIWAERAYGLMPDNVFAIFCLASAYAMAGRHDLVIPLMQRFYQLNEDFDPLKLYLVEAYLRSGKSAEGLQLVDTGLARIAQQKLTSALSASLQQEEARAKALKGTLMLGCGQREGFIYQAAALPTIYTLRDPDLPVWDRHDITGKTLVIFPFGGYGDQLFYLALLPKIAAVAGRILVGVHPDLVALAQAALPSVHVFPCPNVLVPAAIPSAEITRSYEHEQPELQLSLYQLPELIRSRFPHEPVQFAAYLAAPQIENSAFSAALQQLRARGEKRKIIGIAWDRSQRYTPEDGATIACRAQYTSFPLDDVLTIVNDAELAKSCHFVALHEADDRRIWPSPMPANFSRIALRGGAFHETVALLDACDIVISIDMSVANVAAMRGRPTWVLLSRDGDWRWGWHGERSPWIENVRCFRQDCAGDWQGVRARVITALEALPKK